MYCMFSDCQSLKELNLSHFITDNVTDMSFMLDKCSSLIKLDISNFKVTDETKLRYIFNGCSSLKELKCMDPKIKKEYGNFLDKLSSSNQEN